MNSLIKTIALSSIVFAAGDQYANECVSAAGLREAFASPQGAARMNTGPFLWLHQSDGEARLREYVRVIAESGQGTLTIESRPHDGWMGESWWRDVGAVIDECRKRGVKALIYDDYWFPSQCFGAVFPIPREFQCRDVKAEMFERGKAPGRMENEIVRVTARETARGTFALGPDGDKVIVYSWFVADPARVSGLPRGRGLPTVNGLDEAAVDWFLGKFYQPYWDRYRDAFEDGTIIGYFFDESYTKGWWGSALEKELAARGEDVGELLTALKFRLADPEAQARARYRFLDARVETWGRTMFGRHSDWCAKRGVFSSGHFFEHGGTHYDLTFSGGNVMQLLKYVEVPGVDMVCGMWYPSHRADDRKRLTSGQIPKYASSIAHVYNRHGGLNWSEVFGAYGQKLSYPDMKWACDTHQSQGCYFMIPHSFNARAPLDSDCPPYFYNGGYEPRFPLFRVWADYNNRCAMLLSGGEHVCHVAQCMPGLSRHAGRAVNPDAFACALQDVQLDNDFFDYAAVESSRIGKNPRSGRPALKSEKGGEHYEVLVLPAAEYVPFPVLEKALAFAKAGGVVVGYCIRPSNTPTRGKTAEDAKRIVAEIFAQPKALFMDGEPDGERLAKALSPFVVREFDIEGLSFKDRKMLAVNRCEKDGSSVLFIANQDVRRGRDFGIRAVWPAERAELWNPMQGTVERPAVENGLVKIALEARESVFVVWPGRNGFNTEAQRRREGNDRAHCPQRVAVQGVEVQAVVKETVTPVVIEKGPEYARAMAVVKPLDGAEWIWHPVNPKAKGTVLFRSHIDVAAETMAKLVFACSDRAEVRVNGVRAAVQTGGAEPYFYGWSDPATAKVALKAGRNEIEVGALNRHNSESKRQRETGFVAAFTWNGGALRTDAARWEVARPGGKFLKPRVVGKFGQGPWRHCMLGPTKSPYKESVMTGMAFTLPRLKAGERVFLACDGTEGENSAAVEVNGAFAGGFIGAPYRLDITRAVKAGANGLETKPFRLRNPRIVITREVSPKTE